jgi:uncharacterized membrane protein
MRIPPDVSEWLNLLARWFHVFSGILWVGSTYYFTWLDGRFQEAEREAGEGKDAAEVWMVHSGGFYVVQKKKTPGARELHWFRWEAMLTWLSGAFLLVLVYYMSDGMVYAEPDALSHTKAVLFGIGMILAGGVVYDVLVRSPLVKSEKAFAAVAYAVVVGAAYLSTRVLSGRAAFLHVGATMGTIMVANVWMHILPAQRRMIAAAREGRAPDARDAALAKLRSKHNTFMVVPVVFTMISNHYPVSTYGHEYNWLILSGLVLAGWVAAKIIRRA